MSSIVSMPDAQAHQVRGHAGGDLLRLVELGVRGRRRMDGQAPDVADVGQVAEQLESLDEAAAGLDAALDAEGQDGAAALGEVALLPLVPRARLEARVGHPAHLVPALEPLRHLGGVVHVALHAQAQRLQPLEEQERVERGDGRPGVAQVLQAGLEHEARREERLGQLRRRPARGSSGRAR